MLRRALVEKKLGSDLKKLVSNVGLLFQVVYLNILNQEPFFLETPRNQTVSIGQEVILRCSAKGYPTPEISW
jgi:hypothetical protein